MHSNVEKYLNGTDAKEWPIWMRGATGNDGKQGAGSEQQLTKVNLIWRLCRTLREEKIIYCHWKSNDALVRSASGGNDLDLLVSRADVERLTAILSKLGFKQAEAGREVRMPGVLDYYGYDNEADKFVHVHVHYQLLVGHDMTKNYRVPIERAYLESAVQGELFKVPGPEFEFLVFVIRMVLKHATWDAMVLKQGRLSPSERREWGYLETQINQEEVDKLLPEHLPSVSVDLFRRCLRALQADCAIWARVKVGQELQRALKACARRNQIQDSSLKLWRGVMWGLRRRLFGKRISRRRLTSGGGIIAVVGGDGAGKSTAIDGLHKWLSKDFDVLTVHFGKPPWSWTTVTVRGILKLGRLLGLYPYVTTSAIRYSTGRKSSAVFPGYPLVVREVCTARDRYLAYVKARRFATNGGLVISDRFPLSQMHLMDGPLIEHLVSPEQSNWFLNFLKELENRYYEGILWPQLLVVLKVEPEIAVQRKTEEEPVYVRARSQEIWSLPWEKTPARVINGSKPKDEVLAELKSFIWSEL